MPLVGEGALAGTAVAGFAGAVRQFEQGLADPGRAVGHARQRRAGSWNPTGPPAPRAEGSSHVVKSQDRVLYNPY
ncbi:hypothetical protein GCM10009662_38980 [Catellatospora coxensis]|uniref:Uncharacterized protein n=1 Tax=Catellatospora coxensis TaxID=310354 RepID=A0A8J3P653_9ACTN|nr:hypothetical protein Cco03nite_21010 [Catellatospora coxensis]